MRESSKAEVESALKKCISLGVVGSGYVMSMLRQKEINHPEAEIIEISPFLNKYQVPTQHLADYDNILRFTKEISANELGNDLTKEEVNQNMMSV